MWFKAQQPFEDLYYENLNFQLIGVNLLKANGNKILEQPMRMLLCLAGTTLWLLSMGAYVTKYFDDMTKAANALIILIEATLCYMKMLYFLGRAQRFVQLIKRFRDLSKQTNDREHEIWSRELQRDQFIARLYFISCWSTTIVCILTPVPLMIYRYIKSGYFIPMPSFPGIFCFDYQKPYNYAFIWSWTVGFMLFEICGTAGVDCLFGWHVFNISAHFRILRLQLQAIALAWHDQSFDQLKQHLIAVFVYHNNLLDLIKEFHELFKPIIFLEVTISCVQLGFIIYQLINKTNLSQLPFVIMVTAAIIMQLCIYCFGGGRIQNENNMFCSEIYLSFNWEDMTPSMHRLFLLPLMRAQRDVRITGFFFVADRNLLVWVFRTAISCSAIVATV